MSSNILPEVHSWKIQELYDNFMNFETSTKHIKVPTFQRIRCWEAHNKDRLIDSIKNKYPFGEIVLNKIRNCETNDKIEEFIVLDGLQRISTIIEYYTYPLNPESFPKVRNTIFNLFNENIHLLVKNHKLIVSELDKLIKEIFVLYDGKSYFDLINSHNIYHFLYKSPILKDNDILRDIFCDVHTIVLNEIRLNEMMVPVRICYADPNVAHEIFNRLNTTGIKLEKWQIFAAYWCKYSNITIKNQRIVRRIEKYYENKKENLRVIHGSNVKINSEIISYNDKNTSGYNVFEYIVGLFEYLNNLEITINDSKIKSIVLSNINKKNVREKIKNNVNVKKKSIDVYAGEKFIIKLLSVIFNCDEHKIGKKIYTLSKKEGALFELENNLCRTIEYLNPFFEKIYKSANASFPLHQEMICIITETYKNIEKNYVDFNKNQINNHKKLLLNMIYLKSFECWSMSNIKNYLGNLSDFFVKDLRKSFNGYYGDIDMNAFMNSIVEKLDKINSKTQTTRKSITGFVKLFLFALNDSEFYQNIKYDIDHIIPLKQILNYNKDNNNQLSVNHIGNLCCLNKTDNKSKGNTTIFSYYNEKKNKGTDFYKNISKVLYFDTDLITNYTKLFMKSNENTFKNDYAKFINERKNIMLNKICDNYNDCFIQ